MRVLRLVLPLAVLLVVSPLRAACTSSLFLLTTTDAGTRPGNVAVADFNLDGYDDLAIVNSQTTQLTVLLGGAGGTFGTAIAVTTEWTQGDIQAADVNRDGKPDLIVAIPWSENFTVHPYLKVLLGQGNGYFTPVPYTSQQLVFQNPDDMVLGDFDNDGWVDAATTRANGEWSSMKNVGGYFATKASYTTAAGGAAASGIAKGDFDGDGKADIAISEIVSKKIYLFFGNGDGTFAPGALTIDVPHEQREPEDVEAGDFNGDGKDDLAIHIRNPYGGPSFPPLKIALSNGAARTFGTPVDNGTGYGGYELLVNDVDGDGNADVILADIFLGPLWFRGNGDGTVAAQQAFANTAASGLAFIDADKDGGPDLIATNFYTGKVNLFLNSCGQVTLSIGSSQNPVARGTPYTITASLTRPPHFSTPAGTLAIKQDGTTVASTSVNGNTSLSHSPDLVPGTYAFKAEYSGDFRYAASAKTLQQVVTMAPFGPPAGFNAYWIVSEGRVSITWQPTQNTDHYQLWRNDGTGYVFVANVPVRTPLSWVDDTAPLAAALLYKVRAVDPQGGLSDFSAADLTCTYGYTDEFVLAGLTKMKLAHLTELRTAANAARATAGLPAMAWSEPSPEFVRASHVLELRTAINQVRTMLGLPAYSYADPALTPGTSPIRAFHIFELRETMR